MGHIVLPAQAPTCSLQAALVGVCSNLPFRGGKQRWHTFFTCSIGRLEPTKAQRALGIGVREPVTIASHDFHPPTRWSRQSQNPKPMVLVCGMGKMRQRDTPLWAPDTPESEPGNLCLPTTAGCLAAGLNGNAAST